MRKKMKTKDGETLTQLLKHSLKDIRFCLFGDENQMVLPIQKTKKALKEYIKSSAKILITRYKVLKGGNEYK